MPVRLARIARPVGAGACRAEQDVKSGRGWLRAQARGGKRTGAGEALTEAERELERIAPSLPGIVNQFREEAARC